jgi:hypothetical protein
MRSIGVIFYSGRGVGFRIAVAADVATPVDEKNGNAGTVGDALRHRSAEQTGTDNDYPILIQHRRTRG